MPNEPESSRHLEFVVPDSAGYARLDAALGQLFPTLGLRARRRLWESTVIRVNGKAAKPGYMAKPGDRISVCPLPSPHCAPAEAAPLRILAADKDFAALFKPAGLHSAGISGCPSPSLERKLAGQWAAAWTRRQEENGFRECGQNEGFPTPHLLTRLDRPTSGIVLAALHQEAEMRFRLLEKQGEVKKLYFAVVSGRLETDLSLRRRIDMHNRARCLVLPEENPDATRHSLVEPIRILGEEVHALPGCGDNRRCATLVRVRILRGARHQIRAHLADAGFPLLGDSLYGAEKALEEPATFLLHHARLEMPGFSAAVPPIWPFGTEK